MLCSAGLTPLSLHALAAPRYFHGPCLTSQHPALQCHWAHGDATSCTQQYSLHPVNAEQGSYIQLTPGENKSSDRKFPYKQDGGGG